MVFDDQKAQSRKKCRGPGGGIAQRDVGLGHVGFSGCVDDGNAAVTAAIGAGCRGCKAAADGSGCSLGQNHKIQ
jgi:hypothetical protein